MKEQITVTFYIPPEDRADFLFALEAFMRGKVPNGEHLFHWPGGNGRKSKAD